MESERARFGDHRDLRAAAQCVHQLALVDGERVTTAQRLIFSRRRIHCRVGSHRRDLVELLCTALTLWLCLCVQDSGGSVRLECVWPATIAVIIIIAVFYTIRHQIAGCFVRSVEYGVLSANIFGDSIALSQVSPYTHTYTVQ